MQDLIKNDAIRKGLMNAHRTGYFELTSSAHPSHLQAMNMAVDSALMRQVEMVGGSEWPKRYELTFVGRALAELAVYDLE